MTPKLTGPKVAAPEQRPSPWARSWVGGGSWGACHAHLPRQEEIRSTPPLCSWTPMKRLMLR